MSGLDALKPRILFIDDESVVLESLARLLFKQRGEWTMEFETSSERAWDRLHTEPFDAVVADVRMAGLGGLELLHRMRRDEVTHDTPVIFLTGEGDRRVKHDAFEAGASDFLSKPIDAAELCARLRVTISLKLTQDALRRQNEHLASLVRDRTLALQRARLDLIWRLAKAAEYRDEETGNHVVRVGLYAREIATILGLDEDLIDTLYATAPLHDIGKIGIPDEILLKPAQLTPQERAIMERHCAIGARILHEDSKAMAAYVSWRGGRELEPVPLSDPLLDMAVEIAMTHHERYDGTGYPDGLAGEEIPLSGRVVAICDVFDALTSARPYKEAFSPERSRAIIAAGAGTHFDPEVHAAFEASFETLCEIREHYRDGEEAQVAVA